MSVERIILPDEYVDDHLEIFACEGDGALWKIVDPFDFRGFREGGALLGFRGDVFVSVVVAAKDGSVANILPHRYLLDDHGKGCLHADVMEPLSAAERRLWDELTWRKTLTSAERGWLAEVNERVLQPMMPSREQIARLIGMMKRPLSKDPDHAIHSYLARVGLSADDLNRLVAYHGGAP